MVAAKTPPQSGLHDEESRATKGYANRDGSKKALGPHWASSSKRWPLVFGLRLPHVLPVLAGEGAFPGFKGVAGFSFEEVTEPTRYNT